jgi:Ser/Thr protein kinase RdoA (MazF antagonist)
MNSMNVIVHNSKLSLLDFGEIVESWLITELAISIAYILIDQIPRDFRGSFQSLPNNTQQQLKSVVSFCIKTILAGYTSIITIEPEELSVLPSLVLGRIAQSLTIGKYSFSLQPDNAYCSNTVNRGYLAMDLIINGFSCQWDEQFQL